MLFASLAAGCNSAAPTDGFGLPGASKKSGDAAFAEMAWLHSETDFVRHFSVAQTPCLRGDLTDDDQYLVEVGAALFSNPMLLGGLAARERLSCASCHLAGGDNKDFKLSGLSGEPGTADVTSSIFSRVREDGIFNPKPIPDLYDLSPPQKDAAALRTFIESAIRDEFQGASPSPTMLASFVLFIQNLDRAACSDVPAAASLSEAIRLIRSELGLAQQALKRNDGDIADLLLVGVQTRLSRVYERFSGNGLEGERKRIRRAASLVADTRQQSPLTVEHIADLKNDVRGFGGRVEACRPKLLIQARQTAAAVRNNRRGPLRSQDGLRFW